MRKSQLVLAMSFLSVAVACNRADTDENARRAATEMRQLADRAGEQIADSWLATKIQAQYFADADVKARHISVSARDGVVTLSGFVGSESEKEEALSIARNTDGVERLDDRLRVGGESSAPVASDPSPGPVGTSGAIDPGAASMYPTDDASVTTSIQAKFFRDGALKMRNIDVATQGGIVTLRGTVANDNERAQARLLAWTTTGVERVDDVLTVDRALEQGQSGLAMAPSPEQSPVPAPSATPSAPEATPAQPAASTPSTPAAPASADMALETAVRGQLKAFQGVAVTVRDGVVLLDGAVPNAATKQRILIAARQTKGVVQVVDRIRVGR